MFVEENRDITKKVENRTDATPVLHETGLSALRRGKERATACRSKDIVYCNRRN